MGPIIILDKSALQSLSYDEIFFLNKYYFINITPVLLMEILGDLKKPAKKRALSEDQVRIIANKILPSDSAINVHYKYLILNSLMGYPVEMGRRPHVGGGVPVKARSGEKGFIFDVSPEEKALNNWKLGNFTKAEKLLAEQWRDSTKGLDLEGLRSILRHTIKVLEPIDNIEELNSYVEDFLSQENLQTNFLMWLVEEFNIDFRIAQAIFLRWERGRDTLIKDFSPYAYYCFRTLVAFYFGLLHNLIGTKPTNKVDLEYVYYLPFCMLFASNDKFHKSFAQMYLNANQAFVPGEDLKSDLENISNRWKELSDEGKISWESEHGYGPSPDLCPITSNLWRKYLPNWEAGKKRKSTKRSKHESERIIKKMREFESSRTLHQVNQAPFDFSEADFVIQRSEIRIHDPCPCGSGKKFKDCHWPEVRNNQKRDNISN